MRSQSVPEHPQITNKQKKWNLMKTPRLPWFKHIRASDSGVISTPKSLKNLPWNPYCHFVACKHEKVTKMAPKRVPGGTQNRPKIDKNPHLDPEVPCWVPLGATMVPKGAKTVPQRTTMAPPGLPNDHFGHPKRPYPASCQSCLPCKSCQSCQSFQSPVNWLPEGPAAGAKP